MADQPAAQGEELSALACSVACLQASSAPGPAACPPAGAPHAGSHGLGFYIFCLHVTISQQDHFDPE